MVPSHHQLHLAVPLRKSWFVFGILIVSSFTATGFLHYGHKPYVQSHRSSSWLLYAPKEGQLKPSQLSGERRAMHRYRTDAMMMSSVLPREDHKASTGGEASGATTTSLLNGLHAMKLAAFSFAAYNPPTNNTHWVQTTDGAVQLGFPQHSDVLSEVFPFTLDIKLERGLDIGGKSRSWFKPDPDPYVVIQTSNSHGLVDTFTSKQVGNSKDPVFNQAFSLYVDNPSSTTLNFTLYDDDLVQDGIIGSRVMALQTFMPPSRNSTSWAGVVELKNSKGQVTGRIKLELALKSTSPDGHDNVGAKRFMDGDATDWDSLWCKLGGNAGGIKHYEPALFLNHNDTDTQAVVWRDISAKEVVVSFRGSEATRDFIMDAKIIQEQLTPAMLGYKSVTKATAKPTCLAHAGFKQAYLSVAKSMHMALNLAMGTDQPFTEGWTIYITGHSLGGAVATLAAYDLALRYPDLASSHRLITYTFGSPRVGSPGFCQDYNSIVTNSYRFVNDLDLVPRVPRGRRYPLLVEYSHVGKTVLINEGLPSGLWVEGEDPGLCPLRESEMWLETVEDMMMTTDNKGFKSALMAMARAGGKNNGTVVPKEVLTRFPSVVPFATMMLPTLASSLPQQLMALFTTQPNPQDFFPDNATDLAAKALGLSVSQVEIRQEYINNMINGHAVEDHTEARYFSAMEKCFVQQQGRRATNPRACLSSPNPNKKSKNHQ